MLKKVIAFTARGIRIYVDKQVFRSAAALSYFLMLSIFPFFICLYEMLGSMFPTAQDIRDFTSGLLPPDTVETLVDYLGYVTANRSSMMLVMALIAMATASSASFRVINSVCREMRGNSRFKGGYALIFSFFYSILFLAAVYFAAILMITGGWFVNLIETHFRFIHISDSWRWTRFLLLFLILFLLLTGTYSLTAPGGGGRVFAGAIAGSVTLVGVSILFSHFISLSVRYPLVYGSLASVMILMLWLYVIGNIIIAGNIVNVVLDEM